MADATTQMIDAAERIVAESGFAAMTVSAVQQAAGQGNKSAVQYHFGDRDGLIRAVMDARMAPANDRRMAMLERLEPGCSLRDLVEVYVLPSAESVQSREPSYWARFLLQAVSDPKVGHSAMESVQSEAFRTVQQLLLERLDHVPAELRANRVGGAFGYVCTALAAYEVSGGPEGVDDDTLNAELVDACVGLLAGPSSLAADTPGSS